MRNDAFGAACGGPSIPSSSWSLAGESGENWPGMRATGGFRRLRFDWPAGSVRAPCPPLPSRLDPRRPARPGPGPDRAAGCGRRRVGPPARRYPALPGPADPPSTGSRAGASPGRASSGRSRTPGGRRWSSTGPSSDRPPGTRSVPSSRRAPAGRQQARRRARPTTTRLHDEAATGPGRAWMRRSRLPVGALVQATRLCPDRVDSG